MEAREEKIRRRVPAWLAYLLAIALPAASLLLRLALSSRFGGDPALELFLIPIILSSYAGGMGPGLLSTALVAILTDYFLLPPKYSFSIQSGLHSVEWLVLVLAGTLTCLLTESVRRSPPSPAQEERSLAWTELKVRAGFALALTVLIVIGGMSYLSLVQLHEDRAWVEHTQETIAAIRLVPAIVGEAEGAVRGYVIAGHEDFLEPYQRALSNEHADLENLRRLTTDDRLQQTRLDALEPLVAERFLLLQQTVELRREQGFGAAQQHIARGRGEQVHHLIRALLAEMEATEQSLLQEHATRAHHAGSVAKTVIISGIALAFVFAAVALFVISQDFAGSRRAHAALQEAHDLVETRVQQRTAELARTNEALHDSEARLAGIINSAMDAIVTVDEQQRIVLFNPAAEKMFGRRATEAIGQPLHQFIPERFRPAHAQHHRDFGETGLTRRHVRDLGSISGLRASGEEFPIEASISKVDLGGRKLFTAILRDVTESVRAEEALRSNEARFRSLVENSSDVIAMQDLEGNILYASPPVERVLGYRPEEFVGHTVFDFIHPEEHEQFEAVKRSLLQDSHPLHARFRTRHKDGSWRIIESIRSNQLDNPAVRSVVVNFRDVTEAVAAEEALRRQAEWFDQAYDATFVWDWRGTITFWNHGAERLYGYTRDEAVGKDPHKLLQATTGGSATFLVRLEQDGFWEGELEHATCDGRHIMVDSRMALIRDGEHLYVVETTRDITESKRAETALRESEERLQRVTEGMTEGLVISDMEGELIHWNPAAVEMHGFTSPEVWRRQLPEMKDIFELSTLDGTVVPFEQWPFPRIYRGERLREYELRVRRIDRDWERVFSYGGTIVRDSTGKQMAFCTIADITERKRAEEEIRLLNRDLERRVAQRTAELQAANKELESFSYSVAHDLRAPLRAMDGFSDAVLEDYGPQLPEQAREYLETIRRVAQRMGALIDDLLAFSRLNRQPLAKQPVNMEALVRGVLEEMVPQDRAQKIEIVNGNLPAAHGDPSLLRQVWANLISNAIKYSCHAERARIEIGSLTEGKKDIYYVRDNGAGFDMKYADKLFGVFQRLHRADQFEGTGIGLAIVQRVVHRHGGRVWAEAKLNEGATFYFMLGGDN